MTSQLPKMTSSLDFFSRCRVPLVKFSWWSKFHIVIITNSGVMTIFVYKGLTRNPEIRNTQSEFCPIFGDWGKLERLNLAQKSRIKCFWMNQNPRVTAFTISELLRENHKAGRGGHFTLWKYSTWWKYLL